MRLFAFLSVLFLSLTPLYALRKDISSLQIDSSAKSYELKEQRYRTDTFDFSGEFPNLQNIDIDGKRKKRVEMLLTCSYPELEEIRYEGGFGSLIGKLTGSFPKVTLVDFLCSSAAMHIDLTGNWEQNCEINIRGSTGNIAITLPKDIPVIINTKVAPGGKVVNNSFQKKGWGWLNKTFINDLPAQDAPAVLTVNIEATKAKITLN